MNRSFSVVFMDHNYLSQEKPFNSVHMKASYIHKLVESINVYCLYKFCVCYYH